MRKKEKRLQFPLTEKQRRFVEAFMGEAAGNATQAARLAGYRGNDHTLKSIATENLSKLVIAEAIEKLQKSDPLVMNRKERREFWTRMALDPEVENAVRIRASELLAKASGDFIERHLVDSVVQVDDVRKKLRKALEAPGAAEKIRQLEAQLLQGQEPEA